MGARSRAPWGESSPVCDVALLFLREPVS